MAQTGTDAPASPPPEAMHRGVRTGVVVAVVVIVALAGVLAGVELGRTVFSPSNSAKSPYLVVGTNIPFPPFEDYNYTSGAYFGFDIDFAQQIANATHRTMVIQNYADFSVLLTDVGAGVVDMAASAITSSGAAGAVRNMSMAFSNPYYDANQAVLVKSSSTLSCAMTGCTVADLKSLSLGIQTGTTSQSWVDQYFEPNDTSGWAQISNFTTVDTEITSLTAGSIDAVIIDAGPAASIAASSGGGLKVAGSIITNELYSFAVAHGDPEGLLPVINGVISTAYSSGWYAKEIKKWFG
jgi:polar amino acid transport system substrate-binding protein